MARILFTSTLGASALAGSEILWFKAASLLVSRGHTVAAVLQPQMHVPMTSERLSNAGISLLTGRLDRWRFLSARIRRRLKPEQSSTGAPIIHWARRWKADVVVLSQASCWGAYSEMLALAEAGIPYVSISQLNTPFSWPGDCLFEAVGEAFARAKAAVFVSRGNLELFQSQAARVLDNAHVIYNPPSFDVSQPCGPPPTDILRLLNVARIDPGHKGQDMLVEVLAMPKWRERAVELDIAGGGHRVWLERLLEVKGLRNVNILGHVADLKGAWERATFGIFPSRYEGIPLAMIEGMALGRAVVATDVAGHAEWINHGANGFLADGCTARSLDAALEEAWQRRNEAAQLGQHAFATAQRQVSLDPAAQFAVVIEHAASMPRTEY